MPETFYFSIFFRKSAFFLAPWFLAVWLSVFLMPAAGFSENSPSQPSQKVAVIVSDKIKPYLEAKQGLSEFLSASTDAEVSLFFLNELKDKKPADIFLKSAGERYDIFIAVGPAAAVFLWESPAPEPAPRLYCMVLNPEKIFSPADAARGISLNIPAQTQLEMISRSLPHAKRIGLLYDPANNSAFFNKAAKKAAVFDLKIVPLAVSSKKDIPQVLNRRLKEIDALWFIPDRTVISESIVRYIVKDALHKGLPVIGYNRFFYESGAAAAFIFDYKEIGRQSAKKAQKILSDQIISNQIISDRARAETSPVFHVWVNARVMRNLGIKHPQQYTFPVELGP